MSTWPQVLAGRPGSPSKASLGTAFPGKSAGACRKSQQLSRTPDGRNKHEYRTTPVPTCLEGWCLPLE